MYTEAIATGPLEATIHNLGKEIELKTREGQELQRSWITKQTELVALQVHLLRALFRLLVNYGLCHQHPASSAATAVSRDERQQSIVTCEL